MIFTVCEHKVTSRLALLSENDDPKDWKFNGQEIKAQDWQEARNMVDMSNIWHSPYGEYFYV